MTQNPSAPLNPFGPQPGMPSYEPPGTLGEAVQAAYFAAWSELRHNLPHGMPASELDPQGLDSWICAVAIHSASEPLKSFLPEPFRNAAARGAAAAALYDVTLHLATYDPMPHPSPEAHPREPWRPLDEAMRVAFARACEEFNWDFPEGLPFEALGKPVYDLFYRRGRWVAFDVFKPVLPRDAAVQMAEAIAEAAWQLRARELASPPAESAMSPISQDVKDAYNFATGKNFDDLSADVQARFRLLPPDADSSDIEFCLDPPPAARKAWGLPPR